MKHFLDKISKVYLVLDSILESKYKYIAVVNPENGEKIMKIKLNLDDKMLMNFLDSFFDKGFIIEEITKIEFDELETDDILKFKI
jgi:hypothetical protein